MMWFVVMITKYLSFRYFYGLLWLVVVVVVVVVVDDTDDVHMCV